MESMKRRKEQMKELFQRSKIGGSILIVAFLFIGYGIYREEVSTVFQKAVTICLECIGIG